MLRFPRSGVRFSPFAICSEGSDGLSWSRRTAAWSGCIVPSERLLARSGTIVVTGDKRVGIRAGAISGNATINGTVTCRALEPG